MMHRREVVLGGLLTIVWGGSCAYSRPLDGGCMRDDAELHELVGKAPGSFDFANARLDNGSGDRSLDRALAIGLTRLSDMFGVLPGFAFFDDADYPRGNAIASPSQRLGRPDGSVIFGKKLLQHLLQQENGEAAVIGVCAHEFGHIAQTKRKRREDLVVNDRVKRAELHADYLAGYFAGRRRLEKSEFPAAVIALAQYSGGDFSNDPTHHGTPEERGQAVVEGFQAAYRDKKTFDRAFNDGVKFVTRFPLSEG
jgi:hypothetical protein